MRRNLFVIAGALSLAVAAVMLFTGFGFAQATGSDDGGYSYGESSDHLGPGLWNCWGPGAGSQEVAVGVAVDDVDCCDIGPVGPLRSGHGEGGNGEPGDGDGLGGDANRWGVPSP